MPHDVGRLGVALYIYTRPWGRREFQTVANSAAATNGLPVFVTAPNVHFYSSPNLLITGPANFALRNFELTTRSPTKGRGLPPRDRVDRCGAGLLLPHSPDAN